jgi:GNAT superfamily N-acetyltransferase
MNDRAHLRRLLGASTRLWAGADGVTVTDTRWAAFSRAANVEYNVVLCHGASGGEDARVALEEVAAAGVPSIVMLAGEALADAQTLAQAGWVCIGAVPLMALCLRSEDPVAGASDGSGAAGGSAPDAEVRKLTFAELPVARGLLEEAFALSPELAAVALPDTSVSADGQAVWGLWRGGELLSCAGLVVEREAVVGWSITTPPRLQRNGYGARLLRRALAQYALDGATLSLVYSSAAGEALYRKLGFNELERWQMWSRPRWVLALT